jgi:hypothetical protein
MLTLYIHLLSNVFTEMNFHWLHYMISNDDIMCPWIGLSTGAGPYGLPVGLPMGIPAKTLTCRSRLPVAAGP